MKITNTPKWATIAVALMVMSPSLYEKQYKHFQGQLSLSSTPVYRSIASDEVVVDDTQEKMTAVTAAKESLKAAEAEVIRIEELISSKESTAIKINNEEIPQLKVLLELEHERLSGAEIKLTEVKLPLAQAEIDLNEVKANAEEKVKVHDIQKAKLEKLIAAQTAGDTAITVEQIDAQTQQVKTADAEAKIALEAQKVETAKVVTIETEIEEQVTNIEGHKDEILRLETEIKSKEAEALELEAEIKTEEENLEAAKKAAEEAEAALAVAKEDLTNKDKVSTLEDENKEQKEAIDIIKCSSPFQIADQIAGRFMQDANNSIASMLLNLNATMLALTMQSRYDALFYAHNIGQLPNINTLLSNPQSVTINNYSGDFSSMSQYGYKNEGSKMLENEFIKATKSNFNPLKASFGDPMSFNFDRQTTVSDFSRENFSFSGFTGHQNRGPHVITETKELEVELETKIDASNVDSNIESIEEELEDLLS